jgi:hypothetical protein
MISLLLFLIVESSTGDLPGIMDDKEEVSVKGVLVLFY